MDAQMRQTVALLRAAVGFLGESQQQGLWGSNFLSAGSDAFIAPVFPRTQVAAKITGLQEAAAIVHDDRIGVGATFHLFRVPESFEQDLHADLTQASMADTIRGATQSRECALKCIGDLARDCEAKAVGPVRVGTTADVGNAESWRQTAALYLNAFADSAALRARAASLTAS